MPKKKKQKDIKVKNISHKKAVRKHIPTAEKRSASSSKPVKGKVATYQRRDPGLDPQLVWRCKYEGDAELKVPAPPLYIQEKVHPKHLIDELVRESKARASEKAPETPDLFADFNGLRDKKGEADFYKHDADWTNRLILGDALQAMASLSENEGLRGKVQCVYIDPPYGIKFNSNFQWSTREREVKDGRRSHCTREAEQLKAFRDTWRDGIHTYLSYLKDRLLLAHELLNESGSVFVQIGDENAHRVRLLLDEVFGDANFIREIFFIKTGNLTSKFVGRTGDRILWYGKQKEATKFNPLFEEKLTDSYYRHLEDSGSLEIRSLKSDEMGQPGTAFASEGRVFRYASVEGESSPSEETPFQFQGKTRWPKEGKHWLVKHMDIFAKSGRLVQKGSGLQCKMYLDDFPLKRIMDVWQDTSGFVTDQRYVVETRPKVVERCLLMTTDPGDLVLDPTCGSGTTAYVAEQWGRRWITIDTSRVALALARARIMGARYPWYILADSDDGRRKLAEIESREQERANTYGNVRLGFVYEREPHITRSTASNNTEIGLIWDKWEEILIPLRKLLNKALGESWEEWEVPITAMNGWSKKARKIHEEWIDKMVQRRKEMESSIAKRADYELLRDRPYQDSSIVRVSGPFTVETLSPHRMLLSDENGEFFSTSPEGGGKYGEVGSFAETILNYLKVSGVQQANKKDRIIFTSIVPRPGKYLSLEGRFEKGKKLFRAGIFIGPEFGTVMQDDLEQAVQEAAEAGFDAMIACAFSYDAHVAEVNELEGGGGVKVLKAHMNPELYMGDSFVKTEKANLFVIFGEPDIDILKDKKNNQIQVKIKGIDIFDPKSGAVRSDGVKSIACWFVDTDYDRESFFVRQAYFPAVKDPYKSMKATLKGHIDKEAWDSICSDTSRWFTRPNSGLIAVKMINHLGDEVMKVFKV